VEVSDIVDLAAGLGTGQRLLGLDVGAKTVGLAAALAGVYAVWAFGQLRRGKLADGAPAQ